MGIFDKFQQLAEAREAIEKNCGDFFNIVMEDVISGTEAVVNGRTVLLAGSNNYLGLTFNAECIRAACQAVQKEGTGTTGSRMANGTFSGHVALEQELSDFFNRLNTIVFSTGYIANLAMLSTVVGSGEVILLDADCHASIYDGCRLGDAEVIRFRHNDANDLEKRLRRLTKRNTNVLIVVEGLYSMLGDRAPLADIATLKNKYGAYLLVDEAHSLGVLGQNGRGLAEETGVENSVDFVVGTFSKSLGAIGGFCTSNHPELNLVRYASRSYVFTASSSPSIIASTRTALQIMRSQPELRRRLWDNANLLYQRLKDLDFRVGPEASPIIAVRYKDAEEAFAIWDGLLERSVYVNMVLPPATPDGGALLRCSLSAAHTREQVDKIGDAFAALR
ncbi:MAG: aminotransferase class I/II-fold pyridoxal phosphate-dependent enzyme [Deltaproteobacteria bacterium]|nr:aminotransferase class I/II-fold pyridoxal phosphate-dependent enzyme [Deltaproteobacteria bacterium]MBW2620104.1 aminotransferase class I/II-fold pyridoxal phosphate-dependent enzyme [Deltaproteobacteria bacterium]